MKKLVLFACLLPILWTACNSTKTTGKETGEWAKVPGILKNIVPPTFPDSVYDVTKYGARMTRLTTAGTPSWKPSTNVIQTEAAQFSSLPDTISAKVPSY